MLHLHRSMGNLSSLPEGPDAPPNGHQDNLLSNVPTTVGAFLFVPEYGYPPAGHGHDGHDGSHPRCNAAWHGWHYNESQLGRCDGSSGIGYWSGWRWTFFEL